MPGALDGTLVVALEQAVAAPFCSSRLADAGARVVKVERPEGDFARGYDRVVHGECSAFVWLNRGSTYIASVIPTNMSPTWTTLNSVDERLAMSQKPTPRNTDRKILNNREYVRAARADIGWLLAEEKRYQRIPLATKVPGSTSE